MYVFYCTFSIIEDGPRADKIERYIDDSRY